MKLKTSCFNLHIIRKDIFRFAPLWIIYFIGGSLIFLNGFSFSPSSADLAADLATTVGSMGVINLFYAIIAAQLLFGDLFKSRLCNALHAMPVRRETWFMSHLVSGMLFSVVPHFVVILVMVPFCGSLWYIPFLWLLGMTMSYIFFFGVAVFSMLCTGSRFAAVVVYAGINFASVIIWCVMDVIYQPLLLGILLPEDPLTSLCPVLGLAERCSGYEPENLFIFEWPQYMYGQIDMHREPAFMGLGTGWGYIVIVMMVGLVFLVAALLMYRRRAMETAGDFIAVRPLKPVFSVAFTVASGCIFSMFGDAIMGVGVFFMVFGLAIGYFVARMLLQRTLRVFQCKAFLRLGILAAVLVGSMAVVALDPVGVMRWVPAEEDVSFVEVNMGRTIAADRNMYRKLDSLEGIDLVTDIQEQLIAEANDSGSIFTIRYTMKDGKVVTRSYRYRDNGSNVISLLLKELYNTPESTLGFTDWDKYCASVTKIEVHALSNATFIGNDQIAPALEAIRKDIEAGYIMFWGNNNYSGKYIMEAVIYQGEKPQHITINSNCRNFLQWARNNDLGWLIDQAIQ